MAGNKRKTPDINASSQADIAFLLLVFFLVATTMNTDKGLVRVLPPIPPEDVKVEDQKVNERNLLLVFVNASGQLMVGEESMDIRGLKDKAKEFIVNPLDDENLPEKKETEIEMPDGSKWTYNVSEGVVSLTLCLKTVNKRCFLTAKMFPLKSELLPLQWRLLMFRQFLR